MTDYERDQIAPGIIAALSSLNSAMNLAGGMPFDLQRLHATSMYEFIVHICAPNGIRFEHKSLLLGKRCRA